MKLQKGEKGEVEVGGFSVPEKGKSICRILEGIAEFVGKDNEIILNLMIPLQIDRVIEGPEDNEGMKSSDWVCIRDGEGKTPGGSERKLGAYLVNTDLIDKFIERFGEEFDATSDDFIGSLKLKLPDKFVEIKHSIGKNNKTGREQFNVDSIGPVQGKGGGQAKVSTGTAKASGGDADW